MCEKWGFYVYGKILPAYVLPYLCAGTRVQVTFVSGVGSQWKPQEIYLDIS
ncbi:hypothetical protein APA386B_457 [Acetobacter pasteurianus 386B]|nr:hypothetical protein APA386B_457 [Acetobacter pasteurianus 386B]